MVRSSATALGIGVTLILCAGSVLAQSAPQRDAGSGRGPTDAAGVSRAPSDPRGGGQLLLREVETERDRASGLLLDARRARNIPRQECILALLRELDRLVNDARGAYIALGQAIFMDRQAQREHWLQLLQRYRQRAVELGAEASRCGQGVARQRP
ncbi:MAG: hypothetical protein JNK05_36205 [Myxococcales bacterium]|nr:hypothetical protein [Myxococcales bacterium]